MVTALRSPRRAFWGLVLPILAIGLLTGGILVAVHLADRADRGGGAAQSLAEARRALGRGDAPTARELLREALDRDPGLNAAEYELARLDVVEGRFGAARERLENLAERQPSDFPTRLFLAELCLARGDLAPARAAARSAVDLRGDSPRARLLLGRILLRLEEPRSAAREIREALRLDRSLLRPYLDLARAEELELLRNPGSDLAGSVSARKTGMELVRDRLERSPGDPDLSRLLVRLASAGGAAGASETATAARNLLEASPGDPVSHLVAIQALWAICDGSGAAGLLESSARRFPDDARFTLVWASGPNGFGLSRRAGLVLDRAIDAATSEERAGALLDAGGTDPAGLRRAGRALLATGRLRDAADMLEEAVLRGASDREDLYLLGSARQALGDARAARVLVSKAIEGEPRRLDHLLTLAEACLADGDPAGARRVLSEIPDPAGGGPAGHLLRAKIAEAEGGDALSHMEAAFRAEKSPDTALRIALLRRERAEEDPERILTDLLAENPDDLPCRLALCRYRRLTGDWKGAIEALPKETRLEPAAILARVEFWLSRDCVGEARRVFDSLGPASTGRTWTVLGELLLAEGRPRDAHSAFETALGLAGRRRDATLGLARSLLEEGRPMEAAAAAEPLIETPLHGEAAREIVAAAALLRAGRLPISGDPESGVSPAENGAGEPSSPLAGPLLGALHDREDAPFRRILAALLAKGLPGSDPFRLGVLRLVLRKPDDALDAFALARASGHGNPRLDHLRGAALLRAGRPEEALVAFQASADAAPEDPSPRAGILEALLALRRDREAARSGAASSGEFPDYAALHLLRGVALTRLDRARDAESALGRALELTPASVPAARELAAHLAGCGREAEALLLLEGLVRRFPGSEGHWLLLTRLRDGPGDRTGAENALRLGLAETDSIRLAVVLADRLLHPAPPAAPDASAVDALRRALEVAPEHPGVLAMLGEALLLTGRERAGREALRRALETGLPDAMASAASRLLK